MDYALFSIEDIRLLSENLANRTEWSNEKSDITANAEVWMAISGIMLELELPMLKGRSRTEYAREKNMSPWSVDMVSNHAAVFSDKKLHMYEFPKSVQEWMYNACEFGESHEIQKLFNFKKQENVCSEEFIYLLCDACITFGKETEAEALLKELENSSSAGRTAADKLRDRLQGRYDVLRFHSSVKVPK